VPLGLRVALRGPGAHPWYAAPEASAARPQAPAPSLGCGAPRSASLPNQPTFSTHYDDDVCTVGAFDPFTALPDTPLGHPRGPRQARGVEGGRGLRGGEACCVRGKGSWRQEGGGSRKTAPFFASGLGLGLQGSCNPEPAMHMHPQAGHKDSGLYCSAQSSGAYSDIGSDTSRSGEGDSDISEGEFRGYALTLPPSCRLRPPKAESSAAR